MLPKSLTHALGHCIGNLQPIGGQLESIGGRGLRTTGSTYGITEPREAVKVTERYHVYVVAGTMFGTRAISVTIRTKAVIKAGNVMVIGN